MSPQSEIAALREEVSLLELEREMNGFSRELLRKATVLEKIELARDAALSTLRYEGEQAALRGFVTSLFGWAVCRHPDSQGELEGLMRAVHHPALLEALIVDEAFFHNLCHRLCLAEYHGGA